MDRLFTYLQYPFVWFALIVGVLIALCASLLGVSLVLKRFSFIGDGLSHVAFGAMAIASVMKLTNNMIFILPVTILAAVLLLRTGTNSKVGGDAVIAMLSVGALALGYLVMSKSKSSANVAGDVCSTLFGSSSILTLTRKDVVFTAILSFIVILIFVLFYNRIFAITFDEGFAGATGLRVGAYKLLLAIITAIIIVMGMNLIGSLLISALIIFPALSAMRVCVRFKSVIICSAVTGVVCTILGMLLSMLLSTPVGATIVAMDFLAFLVFWILGKIKRIA